MSTIPEEESELLERSLRLQQEQLTIKLQKHKAKLEQQEKARQEILLEEEQKRLQEVKETGPKTVPRKRSRYDQ